MSDSNNYQFELVWQNIGDSTKEEVIQFWLDEGAFDDKEQAMQRANQVMYIMRTSSGEIAGISSVYEARNEQLRNSFYYMRAFVPPRHLESGINRQVIVKIRDFFNEEFEQGSQKKNIGLMIEVKDSELQKKYDDAIWEENEMVYVGKNKEGAHQRVYYFTDARI